MNENPLIWWYRFDNYTLITAPHGDFVLTLGLKIIAFGLLLSLLGLRYTHRWFVRLVVFMIGLGLGLSIGAGVYSYLWGHGWLSL